MSKSRLSTAERQRAVHVEDERIVVGGVCFTADGEWAVAKPMGMRTRHSEPLIIRDENDEVGIFISRKEAAAFLGVSPQTMSQRFGEVIDGMRVSDARWEDVVRYREQVIRVPTQAPEPPLEAVVEAAQRLTQLTPVEPEKPEPVAPPEPEKPARRRVVSFVTNVPKNFFETKKAVEKPVGRSIAEEARERLQQRERERTPTPEPTPKEHKERTGHLLKARYLPSGSFVLEPADSTSMVFASLAEVPSAMREFLRPTSLKPSDLRLLKGEREPERGGEPKLRKLASLPEVELVSRRPPFRAEDYNLCISCGVTFTDFRRPKADGTCPKCGADLWLTVFKRVRGLK